MRRARLSDEIVEQLVVDILTDRYPRDALPPAELQLCERFGASRPVVREAIPRFARNGLTEVRQDLGTVVLSRSHWKTSTLSYSASERPTA